MDPVPRFARASRAAYNDGRLAEIDYIAAGLDFIEAHEEPRLEVRAIAALAGPDLVLAFRGTANRSNALTDARILPATFRAERLRDPVAVHTGFLCAWLAQKTWANDVSSRYPDARRVIVTGHSLGGAIATLAAVDLWALSPIVAYTYGSPRPGFGELAAAYPKVVATTVRVVHALDVVPDVPSTPGYEHVCPALHLADSGAAIGPVRGFFARWLGWNRQALADCDGEAEGDHRIDEYVTACDAYAARFAPATVLHETSL